MSNPNAAPLVSVNNLGELRQALADGHSPITLTRTIFIPAGEVLLGKGADVSGIQSPLAAGSRSAAKSG